MNIDFCVAYVAASTVTAHFDCGDFCDAMTDTLCELMENQFYQEWGEVGTGTGFDDTLEDTELEWERKG